MEDKIIRMKKKVLKNAINLVILFLCTEVIDIFLSKIPELSSYDIRIVFILIISSSLGMRYGLVAAILVSVSYVVQTYGQVGDINVIFLNTNNWIPIVIYVVFSIIVGLKRDKDDVKMANLENEIEQKNSRELEVNEKIIKYEDEIKELNKILMIHNQSYIQVSNFMKELEKNKDNVDKINSLLKTTLKNDTCELVRIEEIDKQISDLIYEKEIKKEKIWVNKKLKIGKPFYMAPISINGIEKMAIIIWECDFKQMNNEYKNQIIGISEIIKFVFEKVGNKENVI